MGGKPPCLKKGHASQGDSVGPQHPHTRAHSTWMANPNSPPSGRAVGGGTAPDLRRPSQCWKASPPGTPIPPPPQRATPARKGACCGTGAGSPRPHRPHPGHTGRGTPAARSRGRAAGGGTAPDTRCPSQRWQATQPGTAPHRPRGTQPPQGMQAKGTVLGPRILTPAPTARGWRTPIARPVGGLSGEGERLTSDAPHHGGRHPPRGRPFATPTASNAGPQGCTLWGRCWVPRPHRPHPGHTGRGTPATRPRGRTAGGGTAPDTRRPSNGGRPPPPATAPHHLHGTQPPQGMQAKGTVMGPHTHTPAPAARGWRTPTARPVGGQLGDGERLTSDAPHNGGRHHPRGRHSASPTASNAGPQGRTLWGRCWVPTPAPAAAGTHRSPNPGRPPQRTGGWGRDSAYTRRPSQRW